MHIPKLAIFVGLTGAFFTLRESYLMGSSDGSYEVKWHHHFNLSTDADTAFEAAKEHSFQMGIELITTRDHLQEEMREIQRATSDQLAERQRKILADDAAYTACLLELRHAQIALLAEGKMPVGQFKNDMLKDLPISYLNWLATNTANFEEDSILQLVSAKLNAEFHHLMLPIPHKDTTYGEVKKRVTVDATVIKSIMFPRMAFNGYGTETCYVTTMCTPDGACLVAITPAFNPAVGQKFTMKATVKEFKEYNGQMQTVVQRCAIQ